MEDKKVHREKVTALRGWLHAAGGLVCHQLFLYLLTSDLLAKLLTGKGSNSSSEWFILLNFIVAATVGLGGSWLLYHWLSKYQWFQRMDSDRLLDKTTNWIAYTTLAVLLVFLLTFRKVGLH